MGAYVFLYSVEALNYDNKTQTYNGLVYADDFAGAMKIIEGELYGNDLIKINEIECYDTTPYFSKETFLKMKEELESLWKEIQFLLDTDTY